MSGRSVTRSRQAEPLTKLDFGLAPGRVSGTVFFDTTATPEQLQRPGRARLASDAVQRHHLARYDADRSERHVLVREPVRWRLVPGVHLDAVRRKLHTAAPSSGAACTAGGQAANGYGFTLSASGQAGADFGFEPWGSASGTVYNDLNQDGVNNDSSPQQGWTVHLSGGSSLVKTTTSVGRLVHHHAPFSPGTAYTVCETPPSGLWGAEPAACSTAQTCATGPRAAERLHLHGDLWRGSP